MKGDTSDIVQMEFNNPKKSTSQHKKIENIPFYPYTFQKLSVIFFYGSNFERKTYRIFSETEATISGIIFAYFILCAAVIFCIRKKNRLHRDGYISSFIDVMITFFAGGNLSMRHKLERLAFGILLIGSFFLTAYWLEFGLYPSFLIHDSKIDTFKKLADISPPIFCNMGLKGKDEAVKQMVL